MRFVQVLADTHVNLDAILMVGMTKDGHVEICGPTGYPVDLGLPDNPEAQVLVAAISAYSDETFYETWLSHKQMWERHESNDQKPVPAPKDGEGRTRPPPKRQV